MKSKTLFATTMIIAMIASTFAIANVSAAPVNITITIQSWNNEEAALWGPAGPFYGYSADGTLKWQVKTSAGGTTVQTLDNSTVGALIVRAPQMVPFNATHWKQFKKWENISDPAHLVINIKGRDVYIQTPNTLGLALTI